MKEENGKPLPGQGSNTLGVRPGKDITPQSDGTVLPKDGGMSVAPSLNALKDFLIPQRLRGVIKEAEGAKGSNSLRVWKHGDGTFVDAPLAQKLTLRVTGPTHGQIEPDAVMPFIEYETALHNTRDDWEIDEGGTPLRPPKQNNFWKIPIMSKPCACS